MIKAEVKTEFGDRLVTVVYATTIAELIRLRIQVEQRIGEYVYLDVK
jgi:hypothetical protein